MLNRSHTKRVLSALIGAALLAMLLGVSAVAARSGNSPSSASQLVNVHAIHMMRGEDMMRGGHMMGGTSHQMMRGGSCDGWQGSRGKGHNDMMGGKRHDHMMGGRSHHHMLADEGHKHMMCGSHKMGRH